MQYKFSKSSLSLLKDCPRCFWLHFNKKIKHPSTIFPSLPSGMDAILKKHFDSYRERGELPPELQTLEKENIKLFTDKKQLTIWQNNFKGIQWKDGHGNLFMGAVDDLLTKDRKIIVMDFKTRGFPKKDDTAALYQDQLDIYNFLLRKNGFETEDYGYLIFYHPLEVAKTGDVIFHKDLVKMKVDVKNAEKIFKQAVEVLDGPIPKSSEECGHCKWAREASI
ncbi:MAG: PD-(D/E)XK nuclease family protein [DPANN group archaeon]|nr:PD-(D/E)XK nuclease family protein [DPANN group archaeon]